MCFACGTHRDTLVTNPVINPEWGKEWIVITTKKTYPWSLLWHRYSVTIRFAHPLIFCMSFCPFVCLPMYCLSFELRFLIIPLVFSTFPCNYINKTITLNNTIQNGVRTGNHSCSVRLSTDLQENKTDHALMILDHLEC